MESPYLSEFDQYISASNKSEGTRRVYRVTLQNWSEWLETKGVALDAATESHAEQWIIHLKADRHLATATVHGYLCALKAFYDLLARRKIIETSPVAEIRFGKRSRIPRIPEIQTVFDLIQAPKDSIQETRDQAMAMMILGSGIRIAEACSIQTPDIDLESGEFRVIGKGDKERVCFLTGASREYVSSYMRSCRPRFHPKTAHLWIGADGRGLSPCTFRRTLQRWADGISIPTTTYPSGVKRRLLTPHKLRHLFATTIYRNGGDLLAIRDLLGHSSVATTQIYTHMSPDLARRAHGLFPGN